MIEVKVIACELLAVRAVPLGRWSLAELREEVLAAGLVDDISVSTIWRWLAEDALRPGPPPTHSQLRKGRAAVSQRSMPMVHSCGQPVGLLAPR